MTRPVGLPKTSWKNYSDEDLLRVRMCDLGLKLRGTELEARVRQLYQELEEVGVRMRPVCFLADEWLSPDGQAAIGIPFYLAHPRLKALEFRMMFEVEGGTASSCMKLLRHEAGHALDHAFGINRRPDWRAVFGSPRIPYNPYFYLVDPHSKAHVRNIPDNYAQCHPMEDFAETFAVWLNPNSQWRIRYQGWPAMRKLRYVDRLMREVAKRRPPQNAPVLDAEARRVRSTLRTYYRRKSRLYHLGDLSFTLRDLRRIFRVSRAAELDRSASAFIRRNKRLLVASISSWSGERPRQVENVAKGIAKLCDEHRLVLKEEALPTVVKLSTYLATLIINRLRTHSYRLTK